jgi:signal transduction histidine kinase/predicted RNA-binding protein with RPS1 domain
MTTENRVQAPRLVMESALDIKGSIIRCQVLQVSSARIIVSMEDGRQGVIRQREISWDRRVTVPVNFPKPGDSIEAVVLDEKPGRKLVDLSIRHLVDPWDGATQRYHVGDPVIGEVVQTRHDFAVVQLEPGIDALVYPSEVPTHASEDFLDALVPGDRVRACITRIHASKHQIELSIFDEIRHEPSPSKKDLLQILDTSSETDIAIHPMDRLEIVDSEGHIDFWQPMQSGALSNNFPEKSMAEILEYLVKETRVAYGFLLKLNPVERRISIIASYPACEHHLTKEMADDLFFSPARDVLEIGVEFASNDIDLAKPRFKNLFPSLNYHSALGLPVPLQRFSAPYALFLLSGEKNAFKSISTNIENKTRQNAHVAASYLAMAIERATIYEEIGRVISKIATGQLANGLIHELNNALVGMTSGIENLLNQTKQVVKDRESPQVNEALQMVDHSADLINNSLKELLELVSAYHGSSAKTISRVDINQLVFEIVRMLDGPALKKGIEISLNLDEKRLECDCVSAVLKSTLLNFGLNSIERVLRYRRLLNSVAPTRRFWPEIIAGDIFILTRKITDSRIQILLLDNGLGFHRPDWDRIFQQDYSLEGNPGDGLYYYRALIERMGGRLYILNSILFVGTLFVIDLPEAQ